MGRFAGTALTPLLGDLEFISEHLSALRDVATRCGHDEVAFFIGVAVEAASDAKTRFPRRVGD